MPPPKKFLINSFENRLSEMSEETIILFSKNDNGIFNVVRGLHKEAFGTLVVDDSKLNFDYFNLLCSKS